MQTMIDISLYSLCSVRSEKVPRKSPHFHYHFVKSHMQFCTETVFKCDMRSKRTRSVGTRPLLQPDQKPKTIMSPLISKGTRPGTMIPNLFLGTGSTLKDFLLLPKHQTFTEAD